MKLPWRPSVRRAMLDRYFWLLGQETDAAWQERCEVARAYRAGLPKLVLSRCPYTQFELRHTFDPYGLDGLWWDAASPERPQAERLYTCQCITGAMTLGQPAERFPFLAKPGPAVPYVIPALIRDPRVTAVVSSFPCGRHRAYCIAYFSARECDGLLWPNEWGADFRWREGGASPGGWSDATDLEELWDFQLTPYVEQNKLFWIAPDDPSAALRSGLAGCPYVNLPGERRAQRVSHGEVWFGNELEESQIEEQLA